MDKRTLLAVVLSVVVISIGFMLQSLIFPSSENDEAAIPPDADAIQEQRLQVAEGTGPTETDSGSETPSAPAEPGTEILPTGDVDDRERTVTLETELFTVVFSNRGGEIVSLQLKEHDDESEPVDMIYRGETDIGAFFISFGGPDAKPVDAIFEYSRRGEFGMEFRRDFIAPTAADGNAYPFTLVKTYNFDPLSYMFKLDVTIENSIKEFPNLNADGFSYSLGFGPQIGPTFESLGGRGEYRYFYTYEEGKRKNNRMNRAGELSVNTMYTWAGIAGKYFAVLAFPDATPYSLKFTQPYTEGLQASAYFHFSRPIIKSSLSTDTFHFYAGPKTVKELSLFNSPDKNPYGLSDLNLDTAVDSSNLLGWLESILKFFLDLFYKAIPNYGVSIILLSIFIKVLFFPITRKSYESTSKMQQLQPKINELKEKLKDNSQRMNQEMAALYKREKVNPLGGCLPILLQMPIFIAFYGVLSKHFALRGAPFFWWITDLSEPDSILSFGNFTVPLLSWTDLRLLPIIYIGTQLLTSKMMQTPNTSTSKNMKMMQYMMPIFFFFILYNAPSGLLLYWTLTNVFTAIQQQAVAAYRKSHPQKPKKDDGKKPGPGRGGGKRK